jgi:serine/threonine protein kinase
LNIRRGVSGINVILEHLSNKDGVSVFDVFEMRHRRRAIVKVQEPTESFQAVERFRREAIALSLIDHPNVVSLYSYTDAEPRAMTMERIPAQNVAERVIRKGPLPIDAACRLIENIAAALDCSHARGILHRDVRPENILLPSKGPARLIDFGLAKIVGEPHVTFMGQVLREHAFASPEQLRGEAHLDARTDVYSLGAVGYYALTGHVPEEAYVSACTYRPELPAEIDAVIEAAMSKNPAQRFHTAGQFAAALRIALESCRGKYRSHNWSVPRWSWLTGILCAVVCLIAMWVVYSQSATAATKRTKPAAHQLSMAKTTFSTTLFGHHVASAADSAHR